MTSHCTDVGENAYVFWDIDNCGVPKGLEGSEVVHRIETFLVDEGKSCRRISAIGNGDLLPKSLKEDLEQCGVKLQALTTTKANFADACLLHDMHLTMKTKLPPCTIVVITGDSDFARFLYDFRRLGYNVHVITSLDSSKILRQAAGKFSLWTDLTHVAGIGISDVDEYESTGVPPKYHELVSHLRCNKPDVYLSAIGVQLRGLHLKYGHSVMLEYMEAAERDGVVTLSRKPDKYGKVFHTMVNLADKYKSRLIAHSTPEAKGDMYEVEFKHGRIVKTLYLPKNSDIVITVGDYVIVEPGKRLMEEDMGRVCEKVTKFKSTWGKIKRLAEPSECSKSQLEAMIAADKQAFDECTRLIKFDENLSKYMELLSEEPIGLGAEWQWDRKKLTFYYRNLTPKTLQLSDFHSLVIQLEHRFKTKVYMYDEDKL
jgi:hypothetical protein